MGRTDNTTNSNNVHLVRVNDYVRGYKSAKFVKKWMQMMQISDH